MPKCSAYRRARIRMIAHAHAPRHLPIQEERIALYLIDQFLKHALHLRLLHRDIDVNELRAAVNAVDVIIKRHRHMVDHAGRIIHAVAEIAGAVVHRYHHFLNGRSFAVVIRNVLHTYPPFRKIENL